MKYFDFGNDRFSRRTIPTELADLSCWPSVDDGALNPKHVATFRKRKEAITLFVESPGLQLAEIKARTGIQPSGLYALFKRCLVQHADGRIFGFRALIPHIRVEPYLRKSPTDGLAGNDSAGYAGAFRQLLSKYPPVQRWLDREILKRPKQIGSAREVRRTLGSLHKEFLARLRVAGVEPTQYPFSVERQAKRSLANYIRVKSTTSFSGAAADAGATNVSLPRPTEGHDTNIPATRPYEIVEADGHLLDLNLTLEVPDPQGFIRIVQLTRIWVIVVREVLTRCVLGYSISMQSNYGAADVMAAVRNCVFPLPRRKINIPDLKVPERSGFPRDIFDKCQYALWELIRLDNHLGHTANSTLQSLTEFLKVNVEIGRPGHPNDRQFIEPFFRALSRNFAHRIPGTTGANPDDVRRRLGDVGTSTSLQMTVDELEDLIEVVLASENGTPHSGLSGRSPLEAMAYHLAKPDCMIRQLPQSERKREYMLGHMIPMTVRGNPLTGRRPYVQFKNVNYSNPVLSESVSLIGETLRVYVLPSDIRMIYAHLSTGDELGPLVAARPWNLTPHSVATRKAIWREIALGNLRYTEEEDPVQIFLRYKRSQVKVDKKAASSLGQAMKDISESPTHTLTQPAKPETAVPQDKSTSQPDKNDLCETTPTLRHRTIHF